MTMNGYISIDDVADYALIDSVEPLVGATGSWLPSHATMGEFEK